MSSNKQIDADHDGTVDTVLIDSDGDGTPDAAAVDVNGDGIADARVEDTDHDGKADVVLTDTDHDGRYDSQRTFANGHVGQSTHIDVEGDPVSGSPTPSTGNLSSGSTHDEPDASTPGGATSTSSGTDGSLATSDAGPKPDLSAHGESYPSTSRDAERASSPHSDSSADSDSQHAGQQWTLDTNGDGVNNVTLTDTDGDGEADKASWDTNQDGRVDVVQLDTDGDGAWDDKLVDTNHDGRVDMELKDTDGDHYYDTARIDSDGDGQVNYSTANFTDPVPETEAHLDYQADDPSHDSGSGSFHF